MDKQQEQKNKEQLAKFLQIFGADKIVTKQDITEVLKGVLEIMNTFKKNNEKLNSETTAIVENLLDKVLTEHEKAKQDVTRETSEVKKEFAESIKEIKGLINKIQTIKPIDGVDGKDADDSVIVEKVLTQIKLPEYKETVLDTAEEIADKLESLKGDERLDASAIKNLPKPTELKNGGARLLQYLADVNIATPTDGQVLTYDDTTRTWKNEASADASVTLLDLSANSTTTATSIYTLTSTIPVNFKSSDGNSILYLDETNERVGLGTASPAQKLELYAGYLKLTSGYGLIWDSGNTQIYSDTTNTNIRVGGVDILSAKSTSVGIGTTSPGYLLDARHADTTAGGVFISSHATYGAHIRGNALDTSGQGFFGNFLYKGATSQTTSGGTGSGVVFGNNITFYGDTGQTPFTNYTPTARMTIQASNGYVGIGTTVPLSQLSNTTSTGGMSGTNATGIAWKSTANEWAAVIWGAPSSGAGYGLRLNTSGSTSSDLPLYVTSGSAGATPLMLVRGDGNVGIGTTAPAATLEVKGTSATQLFLTDVTVGSAASPVLMGATFRGYNNISKAAIYATDEASNYIRGNLLFYTQDNGGSITEKMRILHNGNVGIGTTAPDRLLHAEVSDAVTNAVTYAQRLSHITSGTATTSFGTGIEYELENASGTNRVAGTQEFTWSDATDATEDATYTLKLMRAGTLTEALGVSSTGYLQAQGSILTGTGYNLHFGSNSLIASPSDGTLRLTNAATNDFSRLQFGGTTSSFPSIKRNAAGLDFRLADDSAYTFITASTIELGAATDTTLSRVSAGVIAVEGVTIPTISSTNVLTNKAITQRVVTTTDDATAVIDVAVTDVYELSAIANNTTFSFTGSPTDGQKFLIRYKDAGVSKTLTWTGFVAIGITLPAATTVSKWGYVGVVYNSAASAYHAIATTTEA